MKSWFNNKDPPKEKIMQIILHCQRNWYRFKKHNGRAYKVFSGEDYTLRSVAKDDRPESIGLAISEASKKGQIETVFNVCKATTLDGQELPFNFDEVI